MMENVPMRHLIERVLELSDEEQRVVQREPAPDMGSEEELKALLESLQPRIRVYGVGGAGCNAINRLFDEQLFESSYVTGYAINTDAQALLQSPIQEKVLIGRTARGRGAGGDPTKGEAAALESERVHVASPTTRNSPSSRQGWGVAQGQELLATSHDWPKPKAP